MAWRGEVNVRRRDTGSEEAGVFEEAWMSTVSCTIDNWDDALARVVSLQGQGPAGEN
jgi:hypothetical protein